jgi:hypothetical protein
MHLDELKERFAGLLGDCAFVERPFLDQLAALDWTLLVVRRCRIAKPVDSLSLNVFAAAIRVRR